MYICECLYTKNEKGESCVCIQCGENIYTCNCPLIHTPKCIENDFDGERGETMSDYHPCLTVAGTPAYCSELSWISVVDSGGISRLLYVKKVERLWVKESGPGEKCHDGSTRRFEPETSKN